MSYQLKPSAFDAARSVPDRICSAGWIWKGTQKLDGLCCVKDAFENEQWIKSLTPWLDQASEVIETEKHILILFEKALEYDCSRLGRILPLVRVQGILSSFPIVVSKLSPDAKASLNNHLLLHFDGERELLSLAAFRKVDVLEWWSFSNIHGQESVALPLNRKSFAKETVSRSSTPFEEKAFYAGFEDLQERINKSEKDRSRETSDIASQWLNNFARIAVWCIIIFAVLTLIISPSTITTHISGNAILLAVFIAIGLYAAYMTPDRLMGPGGTEHRGAQGGTGPAANSADARQNGDTSYESNLKYRPSVFMRAAGWLVWNSALGSGLRKKYGERLREVEELFAKGKLDEALKRAVPLGKQVEEDTPKKRNWFGDFPMAGPELRNSLQIRYKAEKSISYGILTGDGYEAMQDIYKQQAEKLAEEGDYKRAAYIYAELLDDIHSAVQMFERAGDFLTAAKLAQGRRLPPYTFIPFWFKAGKKERALKLAAQYDAFEDLQHHVDASDPFYKDLVLAWSSRLVETEDFPRALELTENIKELATARHDLILKALPQGYTDPVLVARALRCLPDQYNEKLQELFEGFMQENDPEFIEKHTRLADLLASRTFEKHSTDENYYTRRLPLWGLPLLRKLVEYEAQYGSEKYRRNTAMTLSEASGQLALRVDLRRLNRVTAMQEQPPEKAILLRNEQNLTPVIDVISISNNRLLIAYNTGALRLINHKGKTLWSDHIYNIRGLVPVTSGSSVLIVRDEPEGSALSLLNIRDGRHQDIGLYNIQAFHTQASEIGWMVFADNKFCMLDMASLVAAAKDDVGQLKHHWSVPINEPGRVLAFREQGQEASLLYQRKQGGLLETWQLDKSTLQVDCSFISPDNYMLENAQTIGWMGAGVFCTYSAEKDRLEKYWFNRTNYSYDVEKKLLKEKKGWPLPDQGMISLQQESKSIICSTSRPEMPKAGTVPATGQANTTSTLQWVGSPNHAPANIFKIGFPKAQSVRAHISNEGDYVTLFDDLGRIVVLNYKTDTILYRND